MRARTFLAGFLIGLAAPTAALAQPCTCAGEEVRTSDGGDHAPLTWVYKVRLVRNGSSDSPPLYCYGRTVQNHRDRDVTDVNWKVASFYRSRLRQGAAASSCAEVEAFLSRRTENGPLYYGVSSGDAYDTQVLPPEGGWAAAEPTRTSSVRSTFEIDPGEAGASPARITVRSSAAADGATNYFRYGIENAGESVVRLQINMPVREWMLAALPFVNEPILLDPGAKLDFSFSTKEPIGTAVATVLASSPDGAPLAIDSVGILTTAGARPLYSSEAFWRRVGPQK